jgi:Fe-S-cluster containining protein
MVPGERIQAQAMDGSTVLGVDGFSSTGLQAPCQTCDACCAAFRVSFYWAESDETPADSVPADTTCQVAPLLCAMKGTDQLQRRCVAVRGDVGVPVWCAIYVRRPSVCHEVAPSGHNGAADSGCVLPGAGMEQKQLRHVYDLAPATTRLA